MLTHSLILVLAAQLVTIKGQVRDARTHSVIPLARVELWQGEAPVDTQYTDDDGYFQFAHFTGGRYRISADSTGYEPASIAFDMAPAVLPIVVDLVRKKAAITNARPVISLREYLVPDSARKEFERARKDVRREDCSKAIQHFENGLRSFGQDASVYNDLGNCYRKLGQLERAEDSFTRARALSDSVYVALNLAEVYSVQKRFKEAETVLLEAIRKRPDAGDAYYGLALVYIEENRLEDAEAAALQADAHPHQVADLHVVLAQLYARQQKPAEVRRQLELYLQEAPNSPMSEPVRQLLRSSM